MTLDLSALFVGLAVMEWSQEQALEMAGSIAGAGQVFHDDGAGEGWAQVEQGDAYVAMVHVRRPFLIVAPEALLLSRPRHPVVILSVDLDRADLVASPEAIDGAFGHGGASAVLAGRFSAKDLWFATV